jgi:hypothetical protein
MESSEVANKRRVLVDALTMCLERSKVCEKIDAQTLRSVLDSAATDLWRAGEFHLEPVWKILCNQPGLSAKEIAPPLLVFKAYESEMNVSVRVPQALSALPRGEQVKLRDELKIAREEFAGAIAELQKLAAAETSQKVQADAAARISRQQEAAAPKQEAEASPTRRILPDAAAKKKSVPAAVIAGAIALTLAAGGAVAWLQLRDTSVDYDMSDSAAFVRLQAARRNGAGVNAQIADPRWDALPQADKNRLAQQLFDLEEKKGVQSLTVTDGNGRVRINAVHIGPVKTVAAN